MSAINKVASIHPTKGFDLNKWVITLLHIENRSFHNRQYHIMDHLNHQIPSRLKRVHPQYQ